MLQHRNARPPPTLADVLPALNLLAFLFHTVLDLVDDNYRLIRKALPPRKTFFDDLRALTRYICFDNWSHLLAFMIRGLELDPAPG